MSNPARGTNRSAEEAAAASDGGSGASDGAASSSPKPVASTAASSGAGPNAREARLRNNREKAKVRRDRKQNLIDDMQRDVVILSKMNTDLKKKNSLLLSQLSQYGSVGNTADIEPVDTSMTDAALTATGGELPSSSSAPMPPLTGGGGGLAAGNTAPALNQQEINQQAQALARLNPSVLVGNPALLQLLQQQLLVQNQQQQQKQQAQLQAQQSQTDAALMAMRQLQAMQQHQQPQQQQYMGGIPQLVNMHTARGMNAANANLGGMQPAPPSNAQQQQQQQQQPPQNSGADPSRPLHIVVHHHHANDGGSGGSTKANSNSASALSSANQSRGE